MVQECVVVAVYKFGDETKFACVDGPEFDGHLVDFCEFDGKTTHV